MHLLNQPIGKTLLLSGMIFLLSSCANTKISQSWVEPNHNKSYKDLLIIGIGESEQTRRAYESYFADELRANKVEAIASYTLIKSDEKIERETVLKAIEGLDIDAVIVTHMVAVDEETVYRPSTGYGYGGYGGYGGGYYGSAQYVGLYSYYTHVYSYVQNPWYYTTHETYTLETNL